MKKRMVINTVEGMVLLSDARPDLSVSKGENKIRKHPFTTAEDVLRDLKNKNDR